jgi:hypothetical protein
MYTITNDKNYFHDIMKSVTLCANYNCLACRKSNKPNVFYRSVVAKSSFCLFLVYLITLRNHCSIPDRDRDFSLAQTDSGAYPACYSISTADFFLGIKRAGREANQWFPSSAEVKNKWSYIFIPPYSFKARTGTTSPLPHAVYCSDYRGTAQNNRAISD